LIKTSGSIRETETTSYYNTSKYKSVQSHPGIMPTNTLARWQAGMFSPIQFTKDWTVVISSIGMSYKTRLF